MEDPGVPLIAELVDGSVYIDVMRHAQLKIIKEGWPHITNSSARMIS